MKTKALIHCAPFRQFSKQKDKTFLWDESEAIEVSGTLKWFDIGKGFGFFTIATGSYKGQDVLINLEVARRDGFLTMPAGAYVEALACVHQKGLQCVRLNKVDISEAVHPLDKSVRTHISVTAETPLEEAFVKWFDQKSGFGFLRQADLDRDLFIHKETLRRFGFTELVAGQKVFVRYGFGSKGAMVCEIFADPSTANAFKH